MADDSTKIKSVKFNGKNYTSWKFSINIALKGKDLIPIVDGTRAKPTEVT